MQVVGVFGELFTNIYSQVAKLTFNSNFFLSLLNALFFHGKLH